jgi:hypothetical protein
MQNRPSGQTGLTTENEDTENEISNINFQITNKSQASSFKSGGQPFPVIKICDLFEICWL